MSLDAEVALEAAVEHGTAAILTALAGLSPDAQCLALARVVVRLGFNRPDKPASRSRKPAPQMDRLLAVLAQHPDGMTPRELGRVLYGAETAENTNRARTMLHCAKTKGGACRVADGKWALSLAAAMEPKAAT